MIFSTVCSEWGTRGDQQGLLASRQTTLLGKESQGEDRTGKRSQQVKQKAV